MADHDPEAAAQDAAVTLILSPEEATLVRTALHLLNDDYTHRDHMHPAIRAILARLPTEPLPADDVATA